jgi:hypothetical protein
MWNDLINKLKKRWNVNSPWQVYIIFFVFAITGSTSAYFSKPLVAFLGLKNLGIISLPIRLLIIFPIYLTLLFLIGSLFGQKSFFKAFEIKTLRKLKCHFIADWVERNL